MLDGLLGRGFSAKCKSLLKVTRTRVDAIKRKRKAMQKYLRKDIADLLNNGLDINAYGRAEGLMVELIRSSCYDFVEQCCETLGKQLSLMQKQRECPEECREAVSSLMFAAARFADLPELRELRDTFTERYGKALEAFVNKELVENLSPEPPTMEKKLQLMREIALESSIQWDSKAFERKIVNPSLSTQDRPRRQGSLNDPKIDDNKQLSRRDELATKRDHDMLSTGRRVHSSDGSTLQSNSEETTLDRDNRRVPSNGRHVPSNEDGYRLHSEGGQTASERDNPDVISHRRWEHADDRCKQQKVGDETIMKREDDYTARHKPHKSRDCATWKRESVDVLAGQVYTIGGFKPPKVSDDNNFVHSYGGRRNRDGVDEKPTEREDNSHRRHKQDMPSHKEETSIADDKLRSSHAPSNFTEKSSKGTESIKPLPPPPYLKPNGGKQMNRYATPDSNEAPADNSVSGKPDTTQMRLDRADERRISGSTRVNDHDNLDDQDDLPGEKKPKPKSVRRRRVKPPSGQDDTEGDEVVKRHPSGRRREDRRQGLQHALDGRNSNDHEDRMMDKLLMHYSKKPSKIDPEKVRGRENASAGHHDVYDASEPQRHRRKGVARSETESVPAPSRAISLPPEPTAPPETERVTTRATSFQPDMFNQGGHVHPRLPDYDDLAAKFAALRGR